MAAYFPVASISIALPRLSLCSRTGFPRNRRFKCNEIIEHYFVIAARALQHRRASQRNRGLLWGSDEEEGVTLGHVLKFANCPCLNGFFTTLAESCAVDTRVTRRFNFDSP